MEPFGIGNYVEKDYLKTNKSWRGGGVATLRTKIQVLPAACSLDVTQPKIWHYFS